MYAPLESYFKIFPIPSHENWLTLYTVFVVSGRSAGSDRFLQHLGRLARPKLCIGAWKRSTFCYHYPRLRQHFLWIKNKHFWCSMRIWRIVIKYYYFIIFFSIIRVDAIGTVVCRIVDSRNCCYSIIGTVASAWGLSLLGTVASTLSQK